MREKVREELEHIQRGDFYQNMLRGEYQMMRMNSLGKNPKYPDNKNIVLKEIIKNVKEFAKGKGIDFKPQFDNNYFKV